MRAQRIRLPGRFFDKQHAAASRAPAFRRAWRRGPEPEPLGDPEDVASPLAYLRCVRMPGEHRHFSEPEELFVEREEEAGGAAAVLGLGSNDGRGFMPTKATSLRKSTLLNPES